MYLQSPKDGPFVVMIGCFDSKREDFEYLYSHLKMHAVKICAVNVGVYETEVNFPIDITADTIAKQMGFDLDQIRTDANRGRALRIMGDGANLLLKQIVRENKLQGIIGMGGGGGTYLVLKSMQSIPIGVPKLCLSTVATKDLSEQVGTKDIVLMSSVVDIAGLNKISRILIKQAAAALVGMTRVGWTSKEQEKKTIAISMFGNTTACVSYCSELLKDQGFEVLCFHAVGSGGRSLESLICEGVIDGVLDITTTELADELCGGICSAGPNRLDAAAKKGVPQVVVPGCLDMVNFAHKNTVPTKYKDRVLYEWSPDVTLMRTNKKENEYLGKTIASKLNRTKGNVAILIPLKGISILSSVDGAFYDPEIDRSLFDSIKLHADSKIEIIELNQNINDEAFAEKAVSTLIAML